MSELDKLPRRVPLTQVHNYSEDISFGALGLPVGMDQSDIVVNLRLAERFRKVAGLGHISIIGDSVETQDYDIGVTGVTPSGEATVAAGGKRDKKPMSVGAITYNHPDLGEWGKPDATVKLDTGEIDKRLDERQKPKDAFDPIVRSVYLDKAIRKGLRDASWNASMNLGKILISGTIYSTNLFVYPYLNISTTTAIVAPTFGHLTIAGANSVLRTKDIDERIELLKSYRYSLTYGVSLDRYIGARALLSRKLISAPSHR